MGSIRFDAIKFIFLRFMGSIRFLLSTSSDHGACQIDAALEMKVGHLDLSFIHFYAYPYVLSVKIFTARKITVLSLEEG